MRIDRVELRVVRLPLVRAFETSFGRMHERTFLLVVVEEDGAAGFGECVADAEPFYSPETTVTAWHVVEEFIAPFVLARAFEHPRELFDGLRFIRGHNMAKAAVEMAAWDLFAKQGGRSLSSALGGVRPTVESGVSIGIQPTVAALVERVGAELQAGYRRIKIKIKPGWDVEPAQQVRSAFPDVPLMVDANAAYGLPDTAHLQRLDDFDLLMVEQPLDPDDVRDHAALQRQLRTPLCLDESISTVRVAEEAIRIEACRVINIKPGRVGGHGQAILLHDLAAAHRIPVWHGGMLESGIGRAHNLHLSALPNFTLPGDIAASERYYLPDVIDPPIRVQADGTIRVPTGPGIGVEIVRDLLDGATQCYTELRGR